MSRINLLAAAIAHEISQPLASVLANGYAARRWLAMEPPNLEEVRNAVAEIILATDRACTVTAGIRDLLSKRPRQDSRGQ
jgi:C4-dicarboxylate-specific signal transduction histidine kinase